MKRSLIIVLFAAVAFAGTKVVPHRAGPRLLGPQSVDPNHPTLEFAPIGGEGMTAACACGALLGTKSEPLVFTRSSSATCLKGSTTAGIADGDMVTCTTDQPRAMPGDDGGVVGLLTENLRSNTVQRSQEFDNAYWTTTVNSVAAPGVAPNQVLAPDGTLTADWLAFPSTSGSQYSLFQSANIFTGGVASSGSVFFKGKDGTSGQICIAVGSGVASTALCAFNGTTWTRCMIDNVTPIALQPLYIGNYSGGNGACNGVVFPASNVYAWGAQGEVGASFSSSYIATTSGTVSRTAENADFAITWAAGTTTSMSMAATVIMPSQISAGVTAIGIVASDDLPGTSGAYTSPRWWPFASNSTVWAVDYSGSAVGGGASNTLTLSASKRYGSFHTGTSVASCVNGVCTGGSASTWSAGRWRRLNIGGVSGSGINGFEVVKQVCLDQNSSTRCR
jgi:hypothetical protein